MRDSDWSRQILLRSDWLGPSVAPITTPVLFDSVISVKQVPQERIYKNYIKF